MPTPDPKDYAYWHAALRGERPSMQERNPMPGYYAFKFRTGPLAGAGRLPVAIWRDEAGALQCRRGSESNFDEPNPADIWMEVAGRPVTEEAYQAAWAAGRFADDLPAEARKPPSAAFTSDGEARPNLGSAVEELADAIDAAAKSAKGATVDSDTALGAAQSLRARLNELAGKAEKLREKEKAPSLAEGKAVDAKWQPMVKKAKGAAETIRGVMDAYLNERDRKAALAAAEAHRQAEEAARANPAAPVPATTPAPPPPPVTAIKGGYGRAASVRVVKATTIVNHADFVAALLSGRFGEGPTQTFKAGLADIANTLARAGVADIPGVEVRDDKKVQ